MANLDRWIEPQATGSPGSRHWLPDLLPAIGIILGTTAMCWRLLASPSQFAINDLGPFGPPMLQSCPLMYASMGLGRENPHTSPSLCDYGAVSTVLGGTNAQHVFLVGCFVLAGLSMYFLLRRIGNPVDFSLLGAVAYELSPIMLSFQTSGEGLLVTAALLPAVLMGAIRANGTVAYIEGARSGAILALVCYANAQAPALAVFLLLPVIIVTLLGRSPGHVRYVFVYSASFAVVFMLAVVPVLQILPGFSATVQASQSTLQSDLLARIAWSPVGDFFTPYVLVGVIPALVGCLILSSFRDVRPAEWAAAASLLAVLLLWAAMRQVGATVASIFPLITLYKDFIKWQIVLAIPLVILSVLGLRWASSLGLATRRRAGRRDGALRRSLILALATLVLVPVALGQQPQVMYETGLAQVPNGQALLTGLLGLPSWAQVPLSYAYVLNKLQRVDPHTLDYRVLWVPIDWRLIQTARTTDTNLLLYWADGSAQSRQAISRTFDAIAKGQEDKIAPLLADDGVKYLVLDLADGQDRNSELWQKGSPTNLPVWGTQALVGKPAEYKKILSTTPGLSVMEDAGRWVIYRNLNWRPILSSFTGLVTVSVPRHGDVQPSRDAPANLSWTAYPAVRTGYAYGVHWTELLDHSVRIEAVQGKAAETPWSPVSATVPVVSGSSYRFSGQMVYESVIQAHAKILWHGRVAASDVTTYLATGHDGSGVVSLSQTVVAPPGASTAEILLMGGWGEGGAGFTRYSDVAVALLTSPDLAALSAHPEQLLSLTYELPGLLVEAGSPTQSPALLRASTLSLSEDANSAGNGAGQIRLLTASDLILAGVWAINAVPDVRGIEHFANHGSGAITVPGGLFTSKPVGSKVVWTEYQPGVTDPSNGLVHSGAASPAGVRIQCSSPGCTIANVLLVPPLPTSSRLARLGYAYSPRLRTPDGAGSPVQFPGDWTSLYSPAPHGYPSSMYDSSTLLRWLGIVFGHLVALAGLLGGLVRRQVAA